MNKAKYRLVNKYGNRVEYANTETEKNALLRLGLHIDEEWQKPSEPKTTPKKKKVVNDNEERTEN
jgi:hypothetical protein